MMVVGMFHLYLGMGLQDIKRSIRSGADASAIPTGEDGVRSLEIARAAIISVSESRTVTLEEVAR